MLDAFRRELTEIVWIARWKQYKVVEFVDATRGALLFDLTEADAVTDRLNGAAEHPEVLANVRACVREHGRGGNAPGFAQRGAAGMKGSRGTGVFLYFGAGAR